MSKKIYEIKTPAAGNVVYYAPVLELDAVCAELQPGVEEHAHAQGYLPATVLRHEKEGQVRLDVVGLGSGTYTARHEEAAPGLPAPGSWCYPPAERGVTATKPSVYV